MELATGTEETSVSKVPDRAVLSIGAAVGEDEMEDLSTELDR